MRRFYLLLCFSFLFSLNINAQITSPLSEKEEEALEFLKTYMPLSDIADYDEDFFRAQVKTAFQAREFFSWGKTIPDEVFRRFVLVYRVNNENLDSARHVFFNKLKDRVKGMSMYDAALEVNHYCHEYVNYKAADGRTSAPLSTIKTSHGRCGEESTFTVTALRAVSIPARQCYTPRWAHTDDNHAWVEVWVDGSWYHLGACEPEPELNIAWFDAPVKRAMMVHTTVFGGNYKGEEEVNYETSLYSKINLLPNYAPTKKVYIRVNDIGGSPVRDAEVDFGLYNYAEFYPLASTKTDKDGLTYLTTGYGDLEIWASKDNNYAYKKISLISTDTLDLVLKPNINREYEERYEVSPPVERAIKTISSEKTKDNARRLLFEDSIRNAYIATFPSDEYISNLCLELNLFDSANTADIIKKSWGNYKEIEDFLRENKNRPEALDILNIIYEKDLRDTPKYKFQSHLDTYLKHKPNLTYSKDIIDNYILNPRIQLELITNWREYIHNNKDGIFFGKEIKSAEDIGLWIDNNISLNTKRNYYGCQVSPKGVLTVKEADKISIEILFVAMARTFYFPAKYDWPTGKAQYYNNDEWHNALNYDREMEPELVDIALNANSVLNVHNNTRTNRIKPEYYTHFTLAKFHNGKFKTLHYEYDPKFQDFPEKLSLEPGYYRLLTGNRDNDGTAYIKTNYFNLKPGKSYDIFVELRDIPQNLSLEGSLKMKKKLSLENNKKVTLEELSNNKGLVLAIIDPYSEPTKHIMVDIPLFKKEFEQWGGGVLFLVPEDKQRGDISELNYRNLPNQSIFALDRRNKILKQVLKTTNKDIGDNLPILLLITKEGEIVFLSDGYRIGSGENLIKTIYQLEEK